ncbi:hypothetical protein HJC23_004022 [Cyclotella cryptica]|uniref:Sulfite exporter TauE/SafE family protein n=1 Tax=Cyclotella cryptica TaxID=29204 RepID=A0ABD3QU13_9STRA|eukprot:CCRYP_002015-RA/>CCRYP_002015-RA protein AED:0.26 eAED:0.26 QI:0/-1/0/1/-1/1/1/0/551
MTMTTHPLLPSSQRRPKPPRQYHPTTILLTVLALSAILYASLPQTNTNDNPTNTPLHQRLLSTLQTKPHHKPLLPLSPNDHLGFLLATLGLMIAAGGGIGGGGVLVPIYILIMGFTPKHAIPLSNITVFGGALANTVLNIRKRHPLADRPLVDWDLILVMEPLTIAGALIGAFFNKLLPEAMLVVSLVALLSFTSWTTLRKAVRMYRAESRVMAEAARRVRKDGTVESELTRLAREMEEEEEEEELEDSTVGLLDAEGGGDVGEVENGTQGEEQQPQIGDDNNNAFKDAKEAEEDDNASTFSTAAELQNKEILSKILEEERHIPMKHVKVLALTFGVVIVINVMKGGGAFPSPLGIRCGSPSFWISNAIMLGWIIAVSIFARSYLVHRYEIKERVGYPYVEGDIRWDARATIVYPIVCTAAGLFAGMFGVGGGIVKGPLMLAMGVHPKVSSASSACMILFTSFSATTSFLVFGLLDMEYGLVCMALGFVSTLAGQIGLFYLMENFQRNSYIAFSIGGIVLLSAFLMTVQSLLSISEGGGPKPPSGLCTGKQ